MYNSAGDSNALRARAVTQNQTIIIVTFVLVTVAAGTYNWSVRHRMVDGLQYVAPEEVGWSSQKLDSLKQLAQESGYAAIIAAYDGKVFFSWGETTRNFRVHSI